MKVSIFGLGYVGAVTAGCLTREGHTVVGVDVQAEKVASLADGISPIVEPGLGELLTDAAKNGLLSATQNHAEAIAETDVSLVCVGTPSAESGELNLRYVLQVVEQIADELHASGKSHDLVLRSTMLPGSSRKIADELLADLLESGKLRLFFYPEFLREGSAVADFDDPSLAVVGTCDGAAFPDELAPLFGVDAPTANWPGAEMLKYACNAFHATKVTFANEIGRIGKSLGIDSQSVMHLLCQDTRLNLSPYYLRPGNPFGGSCLPKDLRALTHEGRRGGVELPLLDSLLPSNEAHLAKLIEQAKRLAESRVTLLGLSFKSDTDDLRESPMVEVAQHLIGRGFELGIYDPQLNLSKLIGTNKRVIDEKMPHLASLLKGDLADAIGQAGLVIAAQKCVDIETLRPLITTEHTLLDVNGWPELRDLPGRYEGFCW
ncbi:MAG: nucleotide sugar dehydrogenase [Verrucomicrobiota bacterium]|jgi:GDP-mannose 6-dehydrogenase|nr:nucleotide sugar dehydrogenase [Verrucomicrobiota bacterium]MDP7049751.1 nucleotide sugar dehydrogenase [Verrucomicrobiota bacterium]